MLIVFGRGILAGPVQKDSQYYLYDRRKKKVTGNLRILGSKSVAFVAIHFGIDDSCGIEYSVTAKTKTAIPVADLQELIKYALKAFGYSVPSGPAGQAEIQPRAVGVFGAAMLNGINSLPADLNISGDLKSTAKVLRPSASQIVWGSNVVVGCPADGTKKTSSSTDSSHTDGANDSKLVNGQTEVVTNSGSTGPRNGPSNSVDSGARTSSSGSATASSLASEQEKKGSDQTKSKDTPSMFSQSVDDEGLYHWDVGLAVPVTGRTEKTYTAKDSVVRQNVSKSEELYAMFHFFPWAVDLKTKRTVFTRPSIIAGIPVANRPFNHPVAGISPSGFNLFGIRMFPWAAVLFDRNFRPKTLSLGSSATPAALQSDLVARRSKKLMIGITFSVKDAQSIVKKQSSNNSGGKSTTTGTGGKGNDSQN